MEDILKRLFLFFVVSFLPTMAAAELSPKDMLAKNRNAAVQISLKRPIPNEEHHGNKNETK